MLRKLTCTNQNIIFEEKSFKRIHTKTYLLGWGGMVLNFFFCFPIYLIQKVTILAHK